MKFIKKKQTSNYISHVKESVRKWRGSHKKNNLSQFTHGEIRCRKCPKINTPGGRGTKLEIISKIYDAQ